MKFYDKLGSLIWIVISIFICVKSAQIEIGALRRPEPGFFPFWVGIGLGMLATVLLIKTWASDGLARKTLNLFKGVSWGRVTLVLCSIFLYALFLEDVGYLVTTFLLMAFLFGIMSRTRLLAILACSLLTTLGTYIVFYLWLKVQLPKGLFYF